MNFCCSLYLIRHFRPAKYTFNANRLWQQLWENIRTDCQNAVETPTNKKRNKIRKDNLLGKLKRKAYNKSVQPVVSDKTGNETDKASKVMMKLESVENKKIEKLNEEFDRMKSLIGYQDKTQ